MGTLDGKTAIVTGAGQGVGRGIALALAGAGANLCLAGRTVSKLVAVAGEIERRGGKATTVACDVKHPETSTGVSPRRWMRGAASTSS